MMMMLLERLQQMGGDEDGDTESPTPIIEAARAGDVPRIRQYLAEDNTLVNKAMTVRDVSHCACRGHLRVVSEERNSSVLVCSCSGEA